MLKRLLTDIRFYLLLFGVFVAGVAFILFMNSVVMPAYTKHDEGQTIPDVTKRPVQKAREILIRHGLRDSVVDTRYNAAYPPGYVIDQSPEANLIVKPGRMIYLTVNAENTPKVIVPDLTNTSLRNAQLQLRNYGLQVGSVTYVSSPFKNTVIKQSVPGGIAVEKGAVINLTVSDGLGINKVAVPKLIGVRFYQAQSMIRNAGLRIGQVSYKSSQKPANYVIGYSPSDKDSLLEGTSINLVISESPKSQEATESGPVFADSTGHIPADTTRSPNKFPN